MEVMGEHLLEFRHKDSIKNVWMEWELTDICLHFMLSLKVWIMKVVFLYYFHVVDGVRYGSHGWTFIRIQAQKQY